MKTWLKGGLIGVGINILSWILFWLSGLIPTLSQIRTLLRYITVEVYLSIIPGGCGEVCGFFSNTGIVINNIPFFVVGAVIGLIIQKVRK